MTIISGSSIFVPHLGMTCHQFVPILVGLVGQYPLLKVVDLRNCTVKGVRHSIVADTPLSCRISTLDPLGRLVPMRRSNETSLLFQFRFS